MSKSYGVATFEIQSCYTCNEQHESAPHTFCYFKTHFNIIH